MFGVAKSVAALSRIAVNQAGIAQHGGYDSTEREFRSPHWHANLDCGNVNASVVILSTMHHNKWPLGALYDVIVDNHRWNGFAQWLWSLRRR